MNVSYLDSIRQWIVNVNGSWNELEDFMLDNNYVFLYEDDQYLVECWMDV